MCLWLRSLRGAERLPEQRSPCNEALCVSSCCLRRVAHPCCDPAQQRLCCHRVERRGQPECDIPVSAASHGGWSDGSWTARLHARTSSRNCEALLSKRSNRSNRSTGS